jgi:hypothetical protein
LVCGGALLRLDAQGSADIAFFECPDCRRQYALKAGKQLTFRWGHPISLALYPLIFSNAPQDVEDGAIAANMPRLAAPDLRVHIDEIERELARPTQSVRDIVDCAADEDALRLYLHRYCAVAKAMLAQD